MFASDELKLVAKYIHMLLIIHSFSDENFRYTLGGYFLANYEDSPAGAFDEVETYLLSFYSQLCQVI